MAMGPLGSLGARRVRIGCSSGFWGDTSVALPQLLEKGECDYIISDFLAEVTMSILTRMKMKNPSMGYATDFVSQFAASVDQVVENKVKLVTNAGGVNPRACGEAIRELLNQRGHNLRIAVVEGDQLDGDTLRSSSGLTDLNGTPITPPHMDSCNAYIGAEPIRTALADYGADIVITGRCADSSLAVGPLMEGIGFGLSDYDMLSSASLAGHLIECGAQATGGILTDYEDVAATWHDIGFPIIEFGERAFRVEKPRGTGGVVDTRTVAEQLVYEIGDPSRYILPDVVCDWCNVTLVEDEGGVLVEGAVGTAPTSTYKVGGTYQDGYRCNTTLTVIGPRAGDKARRTADAILSRSRRLLFEKGYGDFSAVNVQTLGAESCYGHHASEGALKTREVVLYIAVQHEDPKALGMFAREVAPSGTGMAQGITGFGGRPKVAPVIKFSPFLAPKELVKPRVTVLTSSSSGSGDGVTVVDMKARSSGSGDGVTVVDMNAHSSGSGDGVTVVDMNAPSSGSGDGVTVVDMKVRPTEQRDSPETETKEVKTKMLPLSAIAYGRSGDKGDSSNIGVVSRHPELFPLVLSEVTTSRVSDRLSHLTTTGCDSEVSRYTLRGIGAVNFVLTHSLGGGGMASLRNDPQGKGYAQMLMDMPVQVPQHLLQYTKAEERE